MDDLLTDQQQAEVVKSWLRENGLWLLAGVILGVGGLAGWFQWQNWQKAKAEAASAVFDGFRAAVTGGTQADIDARLKELATDHADSGYTDQARLIMARVLLDRNDPSQAAAYLKQVATGAGNADVRYLATLRYARLLIFQEKAADALAALQSSVSSGWAPAFHDVRGDAYLALGRTKEARSEYEQALKPETTPGLDRAFVQAKLDDLGGPTTAPAAGSPGGAGTVPAAAPTAGPGGTPPAAAP